MKETKLRNFLCWGLTALGVVICSIAFAFFLSHFQMVKEQAAEITGILMPIIYGGVLAYLMLPIYNRSKTWILKSLSKKVKSEKRQMAIAKTGATAISLFVLVVIVAGLFWMVIPQIYSSILGLQASFEENMNNLALWLTKLLSDNPQLEQTVIPIYDQLSVQLENWLTTYLVPNASKLISGLSSGLLSVVNVLKNLLIGLIVMVYLLNIKETLTGQGKKIIYSILNLKNANRLIGQIRFVHKVFGGFITGKLLDSLIIGILCFIVMSVMDAVIGMPYVLLISVIVGVTNVIPFFGPFIGAIPSGFLILLVSPIKCLYFLIFIFILQQFDGNILGPKILGDSTGLPSFWVLFSILLFGGLYGFVGMIIAVPVFAVVYSGVSSLVNRSLEKKELSLNTDDYVELTEIDEERKTYKR